MVYCRAKERGSNRKKIKRREESWHEGKTLCYNLRLFYQIYWETVINKAFVWWKLEFEKEIIRTKRKKNLVCNLRIFLTLFLLIKYFFYKKDKELCNQLFIWDLVTQHWIFVYHKKTHTNKTNMLTIFFIIICIYISPTLSVFVIISLPCNWIFYFC